VYNIATKCNNLELLLSQYIDDVLDVSSIESLVIIRPNTLITHNIIYQHQASTHVMNNTKFVKQLIGAKPASRPLQLALLSGIDDFFSRLSGASAGPNADSKTHAQSFPQFVQHKSRARISEVTPARNTVCLLPFGTFEEKEIPNLKHIKSFIGTLCVSMCMCVLCVDVNLSVSHSDCL
jgi:hypothetical protein